MENPKLLLALAAIALISACVQFNEVSLFPETIKNNTEATLWVDVKNTDPEVRSGSIIFEYPDAVQVTKDGAKVTSYPFMLDGGGSTLGRTQFKVAGQHITGQPESRWTIRLSIESGGQVKDSRELVLTVRP